MQALIRLEGKLMAIEFERCQQWNDKNGKEYYSIIKYKYNYIRFTIFKQNVSIRYRENRYKLYKNDDI